MNEKILKNHNILNTKAGGVYVSERAVFRGYDIHKDFDFEKMNLMMQNFFGITGRFFTKEQCKLIEHSYFISAYPDARLWCNRVVALAGTTRSSVVLGMSAGNAVSEAKIYGRRNEVKAISFFIRTKKLLDSGKTLKECLDIQYKKNGVFPGYGRPIANGDERIKPSIEYAKKIGLGDGPHVKLCFEIEKFLVENGKNLKMNFGALVSAYSADLGLSPEEMNAVFFNAFESGMYPCYMEAKEKEPLMIFPTACSDINYEGIDERHL